MRDCYPPQTVVVAVHSPVVSFVAVAPEAAAVRGGVSEIRDDGDSPTT